MRPLQACLSIRRYLASLNESTLRQYLSDNGFEFDADEEREGLELAANRSLQPLVQTVALSLLDSSTTALQASQGRVGWGGAGAAAAASADAAAEPVNDEAAACVSLLLMLSPHSPLLPLLLQLLQLLMLQFLANAPSSHACVPVQDRCRDEGLATEGGRRDFVLRLGRQLLDQVSAGAGG